MLYALTCIVVGMILMAIGFMGAPIVFSSLGGLFFGHGLVMAWLLERRR